MKKLLIIEDDAVVAHVYRTSVEKRGYTVEVCTDGQVGFDRAQECRPDAILLDLMLPKMNGIDFLKKIRGQKGFAALPIIVLTNAYVPNMVEEAFSAGASQVLNKAVLNPVNILDTLDQLLNGGKIVVSPPPPPVVTPTLPLVFEHPGSPPPPANYGYNNNYDGLASPNRPAVAEAAFAAELQAFNAAHAEIPGALRRLVQGVIKAPDEAAREPLLVELYRKVHALTGSAGIARLEDIAQMASAFEVLLKELIEQPRTVNESTLRTMIVSVDFIGELFKNSRPRVGELPHTKILIVDDEPFSRRGISFALKKAHLKSVDVEDPTVALKMTAESPFDLIFLDVQMPGMNGFDLCSKIRTLPLNKHTPIVFVTKLSDFKSRARSSLSGGSELIAKPFLFIELGLKAITLLIRSRVSPRRMAA